MVKDRIIQFIKHLGISIRQFEINCGLSNGMVNNIGDNIRSSSLDKISKTYPILNINWLKIGEGNMLRGHNNIYSASEPEVFYGKIRTEDRQDRLLNTIEKLTETNERNSRSIEIMAKTADRYSLSMERLVNYLTKEGIDIPDGMEKDNETK